MAAPDRLDQVVAVLRAGGGRITSPRRADLSALIEHRGGHPTAEQLTADVQTRQPDVHESTVYRFLDELERLGVVDHVHLGHGPAVYHFADDPHHHLVCEACGLVVEVPLKTMDEFQGLVRRDLEFEMELRHFALPGKMPRLFDLPGGRRRRVAPVTSLQTRLAEDGVREGSGGGRPSVGDPVDLLRSLVASGRFHLDTGFGRIFHPGKISLRENVPTNSLHILVEDNRVSAHVDLVSPLGLRPRPSSRYATGRIAAHNLSGMASDVVRLLRGRQGDHRCELACEWFLTDSEGAEAGVAGVEPNGSQGYIGGSSSVQFEAWVGGRVDEERLAAALAAALCAHPDALRVVDCPDDEKLAAIRVDFQASMVPLQECPPLRVLLAHHPAGDILMLNVNHAASDGFGALRILQALARAYVSDGSDLPHLEFLALRDLPVGPASGRVSGVKKWYLGVIEGLRNALAPPARLVADLAAGEGAAGGPPSPNLVTKAAPGRRLDPQVQPFADPNDDPRYGFHLITLPLTDHGGGLSLAPPAIETDVLVAALHRAIGAWNAAHGHPGHRISILMPSDLRPSGWPDELVGNFSVTARVSTSRRHRGSLAAALKAVGSQTRRNNRRRTGIALISALDRSGLLPLWTRQSRIVLEPITRNRFVDTAILCDLGRIAAPPSFGPGAGKTNEVWFSTPARVPVPLSIGAATLGGRLHLSMRYSRSLFGPETAARFAEYYLVELDPNRPAPPPVAWHTEPLC